MTNIVISAAASASKLELWRGCYSHATKQCAAGRKGDDHIILTSIASIGTVRE
jgi:hypothetical protein